MAALADADRASLWAEIQRELSSRGIDPNVTKAQGRTIVNTIDQFLSDNAAAINATIPQPERGLMPTAAKAVIFRAVVADRYLKGV